MDRLFARWLGCMEYQAAWDLQNQVAAEVAARTIPPTLLLLEHPHTYTLGRSGHAEHLLWDENELVRRGVKVHHVDRGGDITYHGPGQLVAYPILPLAPPGWQSERLPQADFVGYLRRLERIIIAVLADYGVTAQPREGYTGVWVQSASSPALSKIASIGVKVDSRGITRHGLAININPDMDYWNGIVACGIDGVQMTSLRLLLGDAAPAVTDLARRLAIVAADQFETGLVWQGTLPQ